MKNPVSVTSPYLTQFGFKAVFNLFLENLTLDAKELTLFSAQGAASISSIKFLVQDPTGFFYPEQSVNLQTMDPITVAIGSNFNFGPFTITARIASASGLIATISVIKNICEPKSWYLNQAGGKFEASSDCTLPRIRISDKTDYSYAGRQPIALQKNGQLFFPKDVLDPLDFTFAPFAFGESEGIYTGQYRLESLSLASYDLADQVAVVIPYRSKETFTVSCQTSLDDVLDCVAKVHQRYELNRGNGKGFKDKELLDSITMDLTLALVKAQAGKDNSCELNKIKKILNCDCGCQAQGDFIPGGQISSAASFSMIGHGATSVSQQQAGNTTQFKISSKGVEIQPAPGETSFKITKSQTDDLVLYEVEIDFTALKAELDFEERFEGLEASIALNAAGIALKASQTDLDTLAGRTTQAETNITLNAAGIALKASKTEVDTLAGRTTQAETSIALNAAGIALKASKTELDLLGDRLSDAEASIELNANGIALKASQISVDAFNQQLGEATAQLSIHSDQIQSKVASTDFTGEAIASLINQTASEVKIQAEKINLVGKVKITDFASSDTDGEALLTVQGLIKAEMINVEMLIVKHLKTAESGLRREIFGTSDITYHANGNIARQAVLEEGVIKDKWYDVNGNFIYEVGQKGVVNVPVVAESWEPYYFTFVTSASANESSIRLALLSVASTCFRAINAVTYVGFGKSLDTWLYSSGTVGQAANDGYKTSSSNPAAKLPDGWYTFAEFYIGEIMPNHNKYTVRLVKMVDGLDVDYLTLTNVELAPAIQCTFL